MLLALVYLQWLLTRFLSPLETLSPSRRQDILLTAKHNAGSYSGIVGLGYLMAGAYVFHLFSFNQARIDRAPNTAAIAFFFILVGTLANSRALVRTLAAELPDEDANHQPVDYRPPVSIRNRRTLAE